jgi:archaellum component FlaF (FlaF/FlaG flagellin family)
MASYSTSSSASTTWILVGVGVLCTVLIALAIFFTVREQANAPVPTVSDSLMSHEVLADANTSWSPNYANLATTLKGLKLPGAGNAMHNHIHMDMLINGNSVQVPAKIGLGTDAESPLHTHDTSGIVHVESALANFSPKLGQVFDVWGLSFTANNIGGYTTNNTSKLSVYINGTLYNGDPRLIPLNQHDEYFVFYGLETQIPATIPSSYTFPEGL